jgi:hypothetical protein
MKKCLVLDEKYLAMVMALVGGIWRGGNIAASDYFPTYRVQEEDAKFNVSIIEGDPMAMSQLAKRIKRAASHRHCCRSRCTSWPCFPTHQEGFPNLDWLSGLNSWTHRILASPCKYEWFPNFMSGLQATFFNT